MKSIFRTIALLSAFLCVLSCSMDFLYVQLPGSSWTLTVNDKKAFLHFEQENACLMQRDIATGDVLVYNGTYTAKGHAVTVSIEDGSTVKVVRTFSHLKNSSNKNYSSFSPSSDYTVDNTVWVNIYQKNFRVMYLSTEGQAKSFEFANMIHEEGIPYGWKQGSKAYTRAGNQMSVGDRNFTLFPETMLSEDTWYMHFDNLEGTGSSELKGSAWTLRTGGYPGIIVFNTGGTFTRVLTSSFTRYQVMQGTYSLSGDQLTLTMGDKTEQCTVAGNSFTFMEKTYDLFE